MEASMRVAPEVALRHAEAWNALRLRRVAAGDVDGAVAAMRCSWEWHEVADAGREEPGMCPECESGPLGRRTDRCDACEHERARGDVDGLCSDCGEYEATDGTLCAGCADHVAGWVGDCVYACDNCGHATDNADDEGTTCRSCGRGVIA